MVLNYILWFLSPNEQHKSAETFEPVLKYFH